MLLTVKEGNAFIFVGEKLASWGSGIQKEEKKEEGRKRKKKKKKKGGE